MKQCLLILTFLYSLSLKAQNVLVLDADDNRLIQIISKQQPAALEKELKYFEKEKLYLREWNKTFNKYFGSIIGGVGTNNEIGNFASFDPIDGAFKFKGVLPIGNENRNINFLSLSVQGEVLSDNISQLFKDSKLNSNSGIQGEYHFLMRARRSDIKVSLEKLAIFNYKKKDLDDKRRSRFLAIANNKTINKRLLSIISLEQKSLDLQKQHVINKMNSYKIILEEHLRDSNENKNSRIYIDSVAKITKLLTENSSDLNSIESRFVKNKQKSDSLTNVLLSGAALKGGLENEVNSLFKIQQDSLRASFSFEKYKISWLTLIGGVGKKKFTTYDTAKVFDERIKEEDYTTHRFGVAGNLYWNNNTKKRSILLNAGVLRMRDNNVKLQSTKEITETVETANANGVSRTESKKYNAYTKPITSYNQIYAYTNLYLLYGRNSSGLHFFPSYYKPDKKTGYASVGVGFIASFKNIKKDSPIINTELFIELADIFNSKNISSKFQNRNEIGIRFSLPFNFF